ncbi:hypothetical protein FGO68_gene12087 [Halteria grandinella]|uniref:Histidine kinase n=1 Tax=Halteria grandinella TaxID=5974 RepID=A0A8J8P1C0_HALGN|nr:hypothetical protein FGO68_gene12087 [Halteria grandinella]
MLTATISHDMRTPLNAILGMGKNLERYIQHDMGKRFHRVMLNSAALLLFLVNDLLDLFRIKNGKFNKIESVVNFRREISELVDVFQLQAEEKGIRLVVDFHENIPQEIGIDIQRIKQVLINLIGNSLKFTFKGSITISARVGLDEYHNHTLVITVCDTGIGIKQEDRTKIFQMFGKLDATAKINTTGVGLGLSICKKIVEGLEGKIFLADKCDSQYCQHNIPSLLNPEVSGATFTFNILLRSQDFPNSHSHDRIYMSKFSQISSRRVGSNLNLMHPSELTSQLDPCNIELYGTNYLVDRGLVSGILRPANHNRTLQSLERKFNAPNSQQLAIRELPYIISLDEEDEQEIPVSSSATGCPCDDRKDILIVDDNMFNIMTLQCILQQCVMMDSDKAINGLDAVEKIKLRHEENERNPCICGQQRQNYKLVFMDCNMPIMDGLQATSEIRRIFPELAIYIVALTAYTTDEFERRCLQIGMDSYLSKPISESGVKQLVERILGSHA